MPHHMLLFSDGHMLSTLGRKIQQMSPAVLCQYLPLCSTFGVYAQEEFFV